VTGWSQGSVAFSTAYAKDPPGQSLLSMGSSLSHFSSWIQASSYLENASAWAITYRSHFGYLPHDDANLAFRETSWQLGIERVFHRDRSPVHLIPYVAAVTGPILTSEYVLAAGPAEVIGQTWGFLVSAGTGLRFGIDVGPVMGLDFGFWTFWPQGETSPDWRVDLGIFAQNIKHRSGVRRSLESR
jgi:hypothetical protein